MTERLNMSDRELLIRIDERVESLNNEMEDLKMQLITLNGSEGVTRCQEREKRIAALESHRWWIIAAIVMLSLTTIYTNLDRDEQHNHKCAEKIMTVEEKT